MSRPRKPRAPKVPKGSDGATTVQRLLEGIATTLAGGKRDEYELLATYLGETIDKLTKRKRQFASATRDIAELTKREQMLRTQLLTFEPELDGMATVVPIRKPDNGAQPPATQ